MNNTTDRYAVFGNPIAHSKSPQIHQLFAEQTNQHITYTAELADIGQFDSSVKQFIADGGKGLNITVPFKEDAWQLATKLSDRARRAGAVNTLKLEADGSLSGETTDGTGLVTDLVTNHSIQINNKDVLLIGAGGAVRGVIEALLAEQPNSLLITNRTKQKAMQLAIDFSDLGSIRGCGLDEIDNREFDIVINGTSASLEGDLPPLPDSIFNVTSCSYDMMYAAQPTPFMQWSQKIGASQVFDGLGMLVEQAAESFNIWRGVRPATANVIQTIRDQLTQS